MKLSRRDKTEKLPAKKKDLIDLHQTWKERKPLAAQDIVGSNKYDDEQNEEAMAMNDVLVTDGDDIPFEAMQFMVSLLLIFKIMRTFHVSTFFQKNASFCLAARLHRKLASKIRR